MKLFSAKVNVGGSLLNQVEMAHVTAAEVVILRALHGNDAVNDIKHVANVNRSDAHERARLAKIYSMTSPQGVKRGPELVRAYLGVDSMALPDEPPAIESKVDAEGDVVAVAEAEEIVPVNAEPIKRTVVKKPAAVEQLTA